MKSAVGLWIDHSQATIVMLSRDGEKTEHIASDTWMHDHQGVPASKA